MAYIGWAVQGHAAPWWTRPGESIHSQKPTINYLSSVPPPSATQVDGLGRICSRHSQQPWRWCCRALEFQLWTISRAELLTTATKSPPTSQAAAAAELGSWRHKSVSGRRRQWRRQTRRRQRRCKQRLQLAVELSSRPGCCETSWLLLMVLWLLSSSVRQPKKPRRLQPLRACKL
jgi:hypothetical protein